MEECTFSKVTGFSISISPENVRKPLGFLTFSGGIEMKKSATLLKVTLLHGCFSRFLNWTHGTKSRKTSHVCP